MKKRYLLITLLSTLGLVAEPVLYEGFRSDANPELGRTGWLSSWHPFAGEIALQTHGLGLSGLQGQPGALQLKKKGEGLAQINVDVEGSYYGGFRFRVGKVKRDGVLGLLIAKPNLEELSPKTANISVLAKGWRSDHGVLLSMRKRAKVEEGSPIEAQQPYLVLFKVENEFASSQRIRSWILNEQQVIYFANRSFDEALLNEASLGSEPSSVMQRNELVPRRGTDLSLRRGDVVTCVAKFTPKAVFDEIRISVNSLAEAAGLKGN
jgi:hypothetical protein